MFCLIFHHGVFVLWGLFFFVIFLINFIIFHFVRTKNNSLHNFYYCILLVLAVLSSLAFSRIVGLTRFLMCCVYRTSEMMQPTKFNVDPKPQETFIVESSSDLGNYFISIFYETEFLSLLLMKLDYLLCSYKKHFTIMAYEFVYMSCKSLLKRTLTHKILLLYPFFENLVFG